MENQFSNFTAIHKKKGFFNIRTLGPAGQQNEATSIALQRYIVQIYIQSTGRFEKSQTLVFWGPIPCIISQWDYVPKY